MWFHCFAATRLHNRCQARRQSWGSASGQCVGPTRTIKASKNSVVSLVPDGDEMSYTSITIVSVVPELMLKSDVGGVYFCLVAEEADRPLRMELPLLGKFDPTDNTIFLGARQTPMGTYLWGITVSDLIEWTPPAKASTPIDEDKLLHSVKLPHANLKELVPVTNTT